MPIGTRPKRLRRRYARWRHERRYVHADAVLRRATS